MSTPSRPSLVGKAWHSLTRKGPLGLGRDLRDYFRWRMSQSRPVAASAPVASLSNWDLNQQELRTLPEVLRSRPILLYAESTSKCNLHCFMCRLSFPETTRRVRRHMTLDTFARLEPFLEPGSRLSLFGLGEPLLNPDFVEMLRIAKGRGAFVGLNSNAMLLTERIARAMVDLEQDLLVVSFSGGAPETYEKVITGASYDRVLANLRRLNDLKRERTGIGRPLEQVKPLLQLQFTAMRSNIRELPDFVRLAVELHCSGAVVMPLTLVDPSLAEESLLDPGVRPRVEEAFDGARRVAESAGYPFDLHLPTAELLRAWQKALSREPSGIRYQVSGTRERGDAEMRGRGDAGKGDAEHSSLITHHSEPGTQWPEPAAHDSSLMTHHSSLGLGICHEPWQTFYLRDDGTVNTCCYSNRVLGDLRLQTALEVWNGEPYRRFRARMRSDNKPAECRVCHKLRGDDWYDQRIDDESFYDEL